MNNDQLHKDAVKLLQQRQPSGTEATSKAATLSYNKRRKQATAELRPILKQIWDALERGETVGGWATKEDWAKSQSTSSHPISIRQIQRIIVGAPQKRHDVVLKVGMTVKVNDMKVVLTQAMLDLLVPDDELRNVKPVEVWHIRKDGDTAFCGATTKFTHLGFPAKRPARWRQTMPRCEACCKAADVSFTPLGFPKKKAFYKVGDDSRTLGIGTKNDKRAKSTAILHAKKTGWGNDGTLCNAPLIWHDGITGPSDEYSNVGKGKAVNCPKCLEKRAEKSKKANKTRAALKTVRNDPNVQAWIAAEETKGANA